jgi:hypothetical protein
MLPYITHTSIPTLHTHIHIHIYIYICRHEEAALVTEARAPAAPPTLIPAAPLLLLLAYLLHHPLHLVNPLLPAEKLEVEVEVVLLALVPALPLKDTYIQCLDSEIAICIM